MTEIAINPGTAPVSGATEENAAANMQVFVQDLAERGVTVRKVDRNPGADRADVATDGRYCFDLITSTGDVHEIEMPGLPVDQVRWMRDMGNVEQNPWDYPRLYVDGSSWLWLYALNRCSDQAGKEDDEQDDEPAGPLVRTNNDFWIASTRRVLTPTATLVITTRQQAYRTAAWIKLMGEALPDEDPASTYDEVEHAIANT